MPLGAGTDLTAFMEMFLQQLEVELAEECSRHDRDMEERVQEMQHQMVELRILAMTQVWTEDSVKLTKLLATSIKRTTSSSSLSHPLTISDLSLKSLLYSLGYVYVHSIESCRFNKTPFLKNCLGGLLARLIQVLDTTDGLTRFAW